MIIESKNKVQSGWEKRVYSPKWRILPDAQKLVSQQFSLGKCTGSYQVIKTHGSEVDPTGIEGLSNFSLVVDLVKQIKSWLIDLWLTEIKLHEK